MDEYLTHSADETIALGRRLTARLLPPKLVLLRGELGAGKTTIVKGIAEGFQAAAEDDVTSPTFTLIHEYRGPAVFIYHVDLYRVDTQRELETLGLDEIIGANRNLVVVEWGEKFRRFVSECDVEIVLERLGPDDRRVTFVARGTQGNRADRNSEARTSQS